MLRRRHFLQGTLGLLAATGLPAATRAQTIIASQPLAENLYLFQGAGQNAIVVEQPDGLLLIDGGSAIHAPALLETLGNQFGFLPVRTLINTHWHPEQIGLNDLLGADDTDIIAHANTRKRLAAAIMEGADGHGDAPSTTLAGVGLPGITFVADYALELDNETAACGHLPLAHTDGDIFVHFPRRRVLVAGGALSTNGWPVIDRASRAWLGGMVAALARLAALADDATWIVPATGLPVRRTELLAQHARYSALLERLRDMLARNWSVEQVMNADPLTDDGRNWPDRDTFLRQAYLSLGDRLSDSA